MKKLLTFLISVIFAFGVVNETNAQVNYFQGWEDAGAGLAGWTNTGTGGTFSRTTLLPCAGLASVRANIWLAGNVRNFVSPLLGTSNGGLITVTFDYKVVDYNNPGTTGAPCSHFTIGVEWATSIAGTWNPIGLIDCDYHVVSASCAAGPGTYQFTPVANDNVYIRFVVTRLTGDNFYYFDNVSVQEEVPPCTGTPIPGNTLSSSNPVCSGVNFTLSLENTTPGSGVTYQWQSSPDGNDPWTDLGTAATQVTTQTVATYYRSQVTCDGNTGTSNPVYVTMAPFLNCYCTTGVGPTSAVDSDLFRVQITEAGFDHNVGCTGILGVQDFTGLGAISLTQGMTYNMTITMGQCGSGAYTNVAKAWIDFGQDGIYDAPAEQLGVVQGATSSSGVAYSFSFTVPSVATLGETRLRVMQRETTDPTLVFPCAGFSWGSVHDYAVNIVEGSTAVLSWYNLQWPPNANIDITQNVTVYAQCWELGVTEPDGPGAGIECWIGYNTVDATDVIDFASGWTWVLAIYNLNVGDNDEYEAYLGADQSLGEGTYYYASRFRYNNGPFTYGGFNTGGGNGAWDGTDDVSGVLTVTCFTYPIPYTQNFDAVTVPAMPVCYNVENVNADAYTWQTNSTYRLSLPNSAYIRYNTTQAMNDWMFLPGLELTGGKTYEISFAFAASASFPEKLSVYWGDSPTVSAMVNGPIFDLTFTGGYYLGLGSFSPVDDGDYYIGFWGHSDADMFWMSVDDILVTEVVANLTWNGFVDNNWHNPGNWDEAVIPSSTSNVTIPAGLTNYPTVSYAASCNNIFLGSNATNTATLLDNGLLIILGTAIVERYFSGNDLDWHLVSSPVSSATANVFMGMYLQSFDEATNSYAEIIDETTPLGVMEGYGLYSTLGATNTVTFTGNLNLGTQNKGFTANGLGWNLMGNPFASSINWEMVTIPANLSSEVHYIEAATGNDLSYVKGVGGSGSQYIPPMQGFFVSATGSGTLSVGNAQRSHAGAGIFYKSSNPNLVVLNATNGLFNDEAWIHFNELAGAEHDGQFDAHKRISLSNPLLPQIFSYTPAGVKLSVNGLPEVQSVPVGFTVLQSGEFTISAIETGDFIELYLEDSFNGNITNLLSADYTFNYNQGDTENRFILHFAPLSVGDNLERNTNIWSYGNEVIVMVPELTNGQVKVYNMMGQEVVSSSVTSGRNVITVPQPGNYVVTLISNEVVRTEKVVIK